MPTVSKTIFNFILYITLGFFVFLAIKRDIKYEQDYQGDIRNRIVGARLIHDKISPYFYQWKPEDGVRYYDQNTFGYEDASNITASPFLEQLLIPIAELPQTTISKIWFVLQYAMLLAILFLCFSFCSTTKQKQIIAIIAVSLLFTEAWRVHAHLGQFYLIIPLTSLVFIYLLQKAKSNFSYFLAGIPLTMLVLIKPNTVVFFLPFLPLFLRLKINKMVALALPFCLSILLIVSSSFQKKLWVEYYKAIEVHTQMHQNVKNLRGIKTMTPTRRLNNCEGIDTNLINKIKPEMELHPKAEHANFFVFYNSLTKKKIDTTSLLVAAGSIILLIFFLYCYFARKWKYEHEDIRILYLLGICMYMVIDLFSPIHRTQYYTVQWFPAILLFFTIVNLKKEYPFIILVSISLFLNMFHIGLLRLPNSIGEYLLLGSLLLYSFYYYKTKQIVN